MLSEIFDINNFNIVSDDEYYYFFRALNNNDHSDIENKVICNEDGLHTIKTDREYYSGTPKEYEIGKLSLEEVFEHLKVRHRLDTNLISFTSNSNMALLDGKKLYNDEYAIIKVKKSELGNSTILAGLYMLEEIDKILTDYISNNELDDITKYYLNLVDNCRTQEQLNEVLNMVHKEPYNDNMFKKGIEYIKPSNNLKISSLNLSQNILKNKIISKINILNNQILPNNTNQQLIQAIEQSFSKLTLLHYGNINKDEIIECPKEIMEVFSLLQQINNPLVEELKILLIKYLENPKVFNFRYDKFNINDDDITLDDVYEITNGQIDYLTIKNLYKKSFYLAKSKLKCMSLVIFLNNITDKNDKYTELFREMIDKCFCFDENIFVSGNEKKLVLSEMVGLDINDYETPLLEYINNLNKDNLEFILKDPKSATEIIIEDLKFNKNNQSKENWFATAIVDSFDWSKLNIKNISIGQKNELINKLIENNCADLYYKLKSKGIKETKIPNILLTSIIKNNNTNLDNINEDETFTIDEIENFLGYYEIKDTKIVLRNYQASAVKNMNETFENYRFCAGILPTGGGKSFVALAEMLQYKDKPILYLAPNEFILYQIEDYIVEYIRGKKGTFGNYNSPLERRKIISEVFPNLTLMTYQKLNKSPESRKEKYDFIVLDEVHRSGAPEWIKSVKELLDNQPIYTNVLGITATPERDCDGVDMVDFWAKYLGYTKNEINRHKHIAINMDIYEAIKLGYVVNPKVVSCEYDLLRTDGELDNLLEQIKCIKNVSIYEAKLEKYNILRKKVLQANGIEKILNDYLKKGRKYIVFCPIINFDGNVVEDEDGNIIDARIKGKEVIDKYIGLLNQYLGKENVECYSMLGEYSKSFNRKNLQLFEKGNSDKITFLVVMDKANEGMHIKNDGLIWFRALDEYSTILASQQFGRIVYALEPGKEIKEEDLPIAIDLTNNLLRINISKTAIGTKVDDLDKLKTVYNWILEYNIFPDINSKNKIESRYASILKNIQKKYRKYLDEELLKKLREDDQDLISEILDYGNKIDLWNIDIPKKKVKEQHNDVYSDIFELSGILKDFYELKQEVENNLPKLTFEARVEEIYEEFIRTGNVIKTNSKVRFSNGAVMCSWLYFYRNREKLVKYAEINDHAKYIVDKLHFDFAPKEYKMKINLERVIYLYDNYVITNRPIPKEHDKLRFPDGIEIALWLKRMATREYINQFIEMGEVRAQLLYNFLGWDNDLTKEQILENRIQYVYENYILKGITLPNKRANDCFEDGIKINHYLKRNKEMIYELSKRGNIAAIKIIETNFFYSTQQTSEKKLIERIDYIYENYCLKGIALPKRDDEEVFKDENVKIGDFIKRFKKKIIELANKGNIKAQKIVSMFNNKVVNTTEDDFLFELKYVYEQCNLNGKPFFSIIRDDKFPSGKSINNWYYSRYNDIEQKAKQGNKYAKFIVGERKKLDSAQIAKSRINYIYENYVQKNIPIPNASCKDKFEDGTIIGYWIRNFKSLVHIKPLAQSGYEPAQIILKELNISLENAKVSKNFDIKLNYLYEKYISQGLGLPTPSSQDKFEIDGTLINEWLNYNKVIILELYKQGDEKATAVVNKIGWNIDSIGKFKVKAKERFKYILENYINKNIPIPKSSDSDTFLDSDTKIGIWIRIAKVKRYLLELCDEKDEMALAIYNNIKYEIIYTKEDIILEKIKYVVETYIDKCLDVPSVSSTEKFTGIDDTLIGGWIKSNKNKILKYASDGNEYAIKIVESCKLDKNTDEIFYENSLNLVRSRINYLYEKYILNNVSLPKYDSGGKFEDGTPIYKWVNRKATKEHVSVLAKQGDIAAIHILEGYKWGKELLISLSTVNSLALTKCINKGWLLEKDVKDYSSYAIFKEQQNNVKSLVKK